MTRTRRAPIAALAAVVGGGCVSLLYRLLRPGLPLLTMTAPSTSGGDKSEKKAKKGKGSSTGEGGQSDKKAKKGK